MIVAAKSNNPGAIRQHRADVNMHDENGKTALIYASFLKHVDVVDELMTIPTIDLNAKDMGGRSALWYAIKNKSYLIMDILLDAGADINVVDNNGVSIADMEHIHTNLVKHILARLATRQYRRDHTKEGQLFKYIEDRDSHSILMMLCAVPTEGERLSLLNCRDYVGVTPLEAAIMADDPDIVRFLVRSGADINREYFEVEFETTIAGQRFLLEVSKPNEIFAAIALNNKEMVDLLISLGTREDHVDRYGKTISSYHTGTSSI